MMRRFAPLLLALLWAALPPSAQAQFRLDSLRAAVAAQVPAAVLRLAQAHKFGEAGLRVNEDSARRLTRRAAELGEPNAQYMLGVALLRGQGYPRNLRGAVQWLERAAAQNNLLALDLLVSSYADTTVIFFEEASEKLPRDYRKAFAYARQAAALGHAPSAFYLGRAHLEALGTPRNDSLALAWLDTAARRGYVHAQLLAGNLWLWGKTRYGPDFTKAEAYFQAAANHPYAQIEETTMGKVGQHYVRQMPRIAFILGNRLVPFLWPDAFYLRVVP